MDRNDHGIYIIIILLFFVAYIYLMDVKGGMLYLPDQINNYSD